MIAVLMCMSVCVVPSRCIGGLSALANSFRKAFLSAVRSCVWSAKVFFEMPGAAAKFARGASISGSQRVHVILYDTTFNTNRQGLKFGFISSVDEHRRTYILATTMVMNEDHESFEWCLAELKKAFGVESTVIFTDSDPALAKAIAKELPHSKHYLCTFHLSLNLTTNCKAAFSRDERQKQDKKKKGATKDAWWGFKSAWWCLVKDSDQAGQATYSA